MNIKALLNITAILTILASLSGASQAALISDFDLTAFDFDVTAVDYTSGSESSSGTSNGIGWMIEGTSYWSARTITNGTFNYSALPITTDSLHVWNSFTITFEQTVGSLLVAVSNDNTTDSINFGLVATDSVGVNFSGTQVVLNNASGGLVLFENISALTINNLNNNGISDGYDVAFHAVTAVPVPAAIWLFGSALIGLIGIARRKV